MGRRGPPPKPTALRVLTGNAGKRALNKDEPRPPDGPVKIPFWLSKKGRRFWRLIAPILDEMGVLTTADPQALAMLCDVLAEYVEARQIVEREGMTYESAVVQANTRKVRSPDEEFEEEPLFDPMAMSVMIRPRPEVRIASDAWRRARAMMQEFGLTPSARTRVKGDPKTEEDEFEALMSGRAKS